MPNHPAPPTPSTGDGGQRPRHRVWLTIAELLDELGIDRGTLDHWRRRGVGPRMKRLPNGSWRIRGDWFDAWMDGLPEAGASSDRQDQGEGPDDGDPVDGEAA